MFLANISQKSVKTALGSPRKNKIKMDNDAIRNIYVSMGLNFILAMSLLLRLRNKQNF